MATATAYHLPRPDSGPSTNLHASVYPRGLAINDFDFRDTRYPILSSPTTPHRRASTVPAGPSDTLWDDGDEGTYRIQSDPSQARMIGQSAAQATENEGDLRNEVHFQNGLTENQQVPPSKLEAVISYALPADRTRRVVERYSLDENGDGQPSAISERPFLPESPQEQSITASRHQQLPDPRDRPSSMLPNTPRHPSLPAAGIGAGPSNRDSAYSPIIPAAASPSYNIATLGLPVPLSPKPRAYVQQPTYVTPSSAPNPINPIYHPTPPPPQEEVCVECAMRDQDMADVDVTSPGVWERESDALYEDLVRREHEEEASDFVSTESHKSNRPKAKGGRLTESNLKLWLTMVSTCS